jgi:hypothetical protein
MRYSVAYVRAVPVIAVCAALVALGLVLVVRWGGLEPAAGTASVPRYAATMALAGVAAGLLSAGTGGRLAMRLLAITSPEVRGSTTEAGAVIGDITVGGTLGFVVFVGVAAGLLTAAVYALLYPLLPRGLPGGVVLGAVLLVLAGSRLEPLRADNFDFALVTPTWLAVLVFAVLALFQGVLAAAFAARLSRGRPLMPPLPREPRLLTVGRVAAAVVVLVALPGFVDSVADILNV